MGFLESIFYIAWRGVAIGLIISAPMGPVGMLCIQRTLDKGRRAGFYTGIGAALSDLFYSLLTGFGLSFIEEFLEKNQNVIQLIGSAVLIAFGIYLFRKNPARTLRKPMEETISVKKNILSGFLFTFSNPLILFLTIGLFARFNFLLPEFKTYQYFAGFAFIFLGAILWWWFITFSIDKVKHHFNIRSMWLINRIIGVIILLFAVVGIFNATSAMVRGADIRCWNAQRGYGPFVTSENDTDNHLVNSTADTVTFMASCNRSDGVEFRCKVKNYKTDLPWGFILKDVHGRKIIIGFSSSEGAFDGISTSALLNVEMKLDGKQLSLQQFSDKTNAIKKIKSGLSGPDPTGSLNFYKLAIAEGHLSLLGGIHTPEHLFSEIIPLDFITDSIGFFLSPGASIRPDEIRLSTTKFHSSNDNPWTDPEILKGYLNKSRDMMEGYLQILDRSLDETLLRLGGDYRLAMVKADEGYDILYISGAKINARNWVPGMVKAHLSPSGIEGVWNVTWYDSMHQPLDNELKAQTDKNGTLTIQFPYQDSQLRLHPSDIQ